MDGGKEEGPKQVTDLKLYHWQFGDYDLLVMAESIVEARTILKNHVNLAVGMEPDVVGNLINRLTGDPRFVAEPGYPIVIWGKQQRVLEGASKFVTAITKQEAVGYGEQSFGLLLARLLSERALYVFEHGESDIT